MTSEELLLPRGFCFVAASAYQKVNARKAEMVTVTEAEAFFRLDDYVRGQARERKLTRFLAAFENDSDLNQVIEVLIKKLGPPGGV